MSRFYKFALFTSIVSFVLAVLVYTGVISGQMKAMLRPLATIGYVLHHKK